THCQGIGYTPQVAPEALVIDGGKSVVDGAIEAIGPSPFTDTGKRFRWAKEVKDFWERLIVKAAERDIDLERPWDALSAADRRTLLDGVAATRGAKRFEGVVSFVEAAVGRAKSAGARAFFEEFVQPSVCR